MDTNESDASPLPHRRSRSGPDQYPGPSLLGSRSGGMRDVSNTMDASPLSETANMNLSDEIALKELQEMNVSPSSQDEMTPLPHRRVQSLQGRLGPSRSPLGPPSLGVGPSSLSPRDAGKRVINKAPSAPSLSSPTESPRRSLLDVLKREELRAKNPPPQDEMPSSPPDMKPRASRQVLQSFEVYRDEASKPRKPASKIAQELYAVSQERESLLTRLQALNSWEARLLNQLAKEGDAHQG